ncbi:DUF5787 family protein [Halococcus sp. AFM35]|uniref:DUF5787 family protein n=1 Tax=Halococcus sp. AFM35 TaxID=3421653 RepID=UPI003EBE76DC
MSADSEFVFELGVCGWTERNWPPGGTLDADTAAIVARQLGTKHRRWDTVIIEASRKKLARRARFGPRALDGDLLHVVENAPAEWKWYQECLPKPDFPWRYVREAVHRAAGRDIVETRSRGNRIELRRKWKYPNWVERVVAIENKPDLDASAARALAGQVERDVALALCDEVWVATARTGNSIEPVLLEDFPVEAGVLVFDAEDDAATVAWHPRTLAAGESGTRITERADSGGAATVEFASPEWKAEKRLAIAERAYERGWRSYIDTMRPDCRHFELRESGRTALPWCAAKGRHQSAAECSGSCSEFEPEPPTWRSQGWPIEGGPGRAIDRLLADRRARQRPEE